MEGQETSDLDPHQGKPKIFVLLHTSRCTQGLRVISSYIREKEIKSCIQQIMGVSRDDFGNIKGTKIVHGVQIFCRGTGKAIKV